MYRTHELLKEPSPRALLWRYMDFTKFISLLETQKLHFSSLSSFEDPFEGHPPRIEVEVHRAMPFGLTRKQYKELGAKIKEEIEALQGWRNKIAASCWHINGVESAAMWSLYLKSGEGIAIRTTFQRLKRALPTSGVDVFGGKVQYVDYDTFLSPHRDPYVWATYKRLSFEHEKEFRFLTPVNDTETAVAVPIELGELIESIYVSPTVPSWISDLVKKVAHRYGITAEIRQSEINSGPAYY